MKHLPFLFPLILIHLLGCKPQLMTSYSLRATIQAEDAEQARALAPIYQARLIAYMGQETGFSMQHLDNTIDISFKGPIDAAVLQELLSAPGKLELVETYVSSEFMDSLMVMNEYVREHKLMEGKMPADSLDETYPLFSLLYLAYWIDPRPDIVDMAYCRLTDRPILEQLIEEGGILPFLPPGGDLLWHKYPDFRIDSIHRKLIIAKRLSGTYWKLNDMMEGVSIEGKNYWGDYMVLLNLKSPHHQTWSQITGDNINRYLATVLDGVVLSCPRVNEKMTNRVIGLSLPNKAEAQLIGAILSSGPIPEEVSGLKIEIKAGQKTAS